MSTKILLTFVDGIVLCDHVQRDPVMCLEVNSSFVTGSLGRI